LSEQYSLKKMGRFCIKCGTQIPENVSFCVGCGLKLDGLTARAEEIPQQYKQLQPGQSRRRQYATTLPAQAQGQNMQQYQTQQQAAQPEEPLEPPRKKKKAGKIILVILAVLVIIAGAGFFYLRRALETPPDMRENRRGPERIEVSGGGGLFGKVGNLIDSNVRDTTKYT